MDNLSKRLSCKVDVYGRISFENKLGEKDYEDGFIKSAFAEILPTGGTVRTTEGGGIYAEVSHKITIREKSIPGLTNEMYFMYKGQRFDIKFTQPNYKYKDSIEIMCNLVVE